MDKVTLKDIGGELIKDNEQYVLKDNAFGKNLILSSTMLRAKQNTNGHTHKGQIFPFNFFVRLQFKHVYGLFQKFNSKLYVSSGCGCWGPKMRLGSRNEIVEILITKKSV